MHNLQEPQELRQKGRSTAQMKVLKRGALFIIGSLWARRYYRDLALKIGRDDIQFMSVEGMCVRNWTGKVFTEVAVDHAIVLDRPEEFQALDDLKTYITRFQHGDSTQGCGDGGS